MSARLTPLDSFRVARGLRVVLSIGCPALALGQAWIAWTVWQDRLAGRVWDNPWTFGLMLATLFGLAAFFLAGLVLGWRARIELREDGFDLRGLWRTRRFAWSQVEGFRRQRAQMFVYLAGDELPLSVSHFERPRALEAWFAARVPDLHAQELAREAREISADTSLGFTDVERAARLEALRRLVRAVSWPGYLAAAVGALNALFLERADAQLVAACVLAAVPPLLVLLALQFRDQVRIGPAEGSAFPDALPGILAASLALGLMAVLDPHTLLGDRFLAWTAPLAVVLAGLWLLAERERLAAHARAYAVALLVAAAAALSAAWAGGSIYLLNTGADDSPVAWEETRVTKKRTSTTKAGRLYHLTVAPWRTSREPVELQVARRTYAALRVGAKVAVGVRSGALGIPWVAGVRPAGRRR